MQNRMTIRTKLFVPLLSLLATFSVLATSIYSADVYAFPRERAEDVELYAAGEIHHARIENLWPTQSRVGFEAVNERIDKIGSMSRKERHKYIHDNPIPVIVGPGEKLYVVDHHHLARAVHDLDHSKVFVKVIENWHDLTIEEFWQRMRARHFVYQYDTMQGRVVSVYDLPRHIEQMKDDPYRSMAGQLRDDGFFEKKTGQYFIEFVWAKALRAYFRKIDFDVEKESYKGALKLARKYAASPAAADLPGRVASQCKRFLSKQ